MRESTKATRATILQSAKEIFLECGYQEASMRKIASRAGITPGAIYKHFSGKEEMFGEICRSTPKYLQRAKSEIESNAPA